MPKLERSLTSFEFVHGGVISPTVSARLSYLIHLTRVRRAAGNQDP